MKRMLVLTAFLVLLLPVAGMAGAFETGGQLHEKWKDYQLEGNAFLEGVFAGYVVGIVDYISVEEGITLTPDGVSVDQVCTIVGKYLESHPEKWSLPGTAVVLAALREAFPKAGKRSTK